MGEKVTLGIELERFESFDWRRFITNIDQIPAAAAKDLDALNELVNSGDEDGKHFLDDLSRGSLSRPVTAMVQYYRDMFQPEELRELHGAIDAGKEKSGFVIKQSKE